MPNPRPSAILYNRPCTRGEPVHNGPFEENRQVSSEISGREIELRRNVPYPEVPEHKKTGVEKVTDVLVYQGKVSEEQLHLAREAQKNNPRQDLGKILLSLGFISG